MKTGRAMIVTRGSEKYMRGYLAALRGETREQRDGGIQFHGTTTKSDVPVINGPLDFPADQQERRQLPNGTEYFGASGTITNIGSAARRVPAILIVLRDARDRIVYSWEVEPPKRNLAPGETVSVNEAVTDVPRSAKFAEIGWKPD